MRVLFIPSGDDKYGAPKSMMELVGNLKNRHKIEPVVLTHTHCKINEWCNRNNIDCHVLGQSEFMVVGGSNPFRKVVKHSMYPYLRAQYLLDSIRAKKKIEELVHSEKIDIVHTNVNRVDTGGYYARLHDIPHVMHLREFGKEDYNCMYLRPDAIDFMNQTTTKFIAISNAVKNAWIQKGLDSSKIEVIYNGVDFSRFPLSFPSCSTANRNVLKIVFVGIISETKGQSQLIKAVELLPDDIKNKIQVDFYGGGRKAYICRLKKYVLNRNLDKIISFKGYSDSIPTTLPHYDIGVVSSRAEAFGRVTVEYMAAGLCVIASDTGANPEIIQDEKTGLIYRSGDPTDLARCIVQLINNPESLFFMREAAYRSVHQRYTMDRCSDEIYSLYERLLKKYDRNSDSI